jgi:diguanylate cyclase (GGDEF)-like protein
VSDLSADLAPEPAPAERSRAFADWFLGLLLLVEATAAGFVAASGRGRVLEMVLVGIACLVAYTAGWRIGRIVPLPLLLAFLALEWHYGRLVHRHYWTEVILALGVTGSAYAAAYARRLATVREEEVEQSLLHLRNARTADAVTVALGAQGHPPGSLVYELERARRHNHVLSVLLVHADELDAIARHWGPDASARVLGAIAGAIAHSLRATDIALREGPSDFAVVLPETDRDGARNVAERIRLAVAEKQLDFGLGEVVDATVSIGVASFPGDAFSNDDLTRAMHEALAAATSAGGNRTMLYSVPEGAPAGWGLKTAL